MTSHKVTLKPSGQVVEVKEGVNLLEALRANDIYVKSSCGGHATCSDCIIKVVSGEDNVTPPPFEELKILGNVFHITKERLACQTCVTGDVTLDIAKHDKASDEDKLRSKTSNFSKKKVQTHVRKETEVKEKSRAQMQEREEFEKKQKESSENWKNHWEKARDGEAPKKLHGGKRPKFFNTDKVDYENDTYTRPLDKVKKQLRDERREKEFAAQKEHAKDHARDNVKKDEFFSDKKLSDQKTQDQKDNKDFKKFRG